MRAVLTLGWAAVRRHRVQSVVIGAVVLLSSATLVLGLGLLVASDGPFDRAFARQHGAHATASFDSPVSLRTTASRPGVTAAAGPYGTVTATLLGNGQPVAPPGVIAERSDPGSAVDRLVVAHGHWLTGPGQIVLSRAVPGFGNWWRLGSRLTLDVPGRPAVVVVGVAGSATGTATAWVWPGTTRVTGWQMLYRFASAADPGAVRASLATATAGLRVTGSTSYLAVRLSAAGNLRTFVPFVVAFAVLGLVISVLIIGNVVAGAVVAGVRAIGIQKTLGFTPAQVVLVCAGQILTVCLPAAVAGTALGYLGAIPIMRQTADAYGVAGSTSVPIWVGLTVLIGLPLVVGVVAVLTAARAGRMSAVQAITVGRAPRSGRGFRLRRALAATRLPQPIAFGLGMPFARPARSAVTVLAVLLGASTLIFSVGLATSLSRVVADFDRSAAVPVQVSAAGGPMPPGAQTDPASSADPATIRRTILATAGTAHVVGMIPVQAGLAGSSQPVDVWSYDGDASWTGYPMLAGRWYHNPSEAVVSSRTLRLTGTRIGDTITLTTEGGSRRVTIVGSAFTNGTGATVIMAAAGLPDPGRPAVYEVALTAGTDPGRYADRLTRALNGAGQAQPTAAAQSHETIAVMLALIGTLSLLLGAVTALGVLNTVVLNTRERIHEIGILKAIGQTPRQVRLTVISSMVTIGLVGGVLAVPLGLLLHRVLVRAIANAAATALPADVSAAFGPLELAGLAATGIVLAVLGALIPAGWAAATSVSTALRAE